MKQALTTKGFYFFIDKKSIIFEVINMNLTALLAMGPLGLAVWQWIIVVAVCILIVVGLFKKAFKLVKLVILLGIIFVALSYFGVI